MRTVVNGVVVGLACALMMATTVQAGEGTPTGVVIHITGATYTSCDPAAVVDEDLTCESINAVGDPEAALPQWVWLIAYGWEELPGWPVDKGIAGVRLGITYPKSVIVSGWNLCTQGNQIPSDDFPEWPMSESGNAITWGGPVNPNVGYSPDSGFARIGYFTVDLGSTGRMTVTADPRTKTMEVASGGGAFTADLPPEAYSNADVGGTNPADGRPSCGGPVPVVGTTWGGIKAQFD